jgi:hypothetical protein
MEFFTQEAQSRKDLIRLALCAIQLPQWGRNEIEHGASPLEKLDRKPLLARLMRSPTSALDAPLVLWQPRF